ncbi:MAG: LapA family protein [Deltaproteobacteria bacterium]|nr:LapA family protein [Deltaproteobacteria bacterium]
MTFKMIITLILAGLAVLFIIQNSDVVQVSFLIWHITLSRALLIFFSLLIGFIIGWFMNGYFSYRRAKREFESERSILKR